MQNNVSILFFSLTAALTSIASWSQSANANAAIGFNLGIGLPFTQQLGVNYQFSDQVSFEVSANRGTYNRTCSDFDLRVTQFGAHYHPFGGSLYLGGGVAKENLKVSNIYTPTNKEFTIKVDANLTFAKLGWMWGLSNGGFWFGSDVASYQSIGSTRSIDAPGVDTASQDYIDAITPAKKFGDTNFLSITFARFGWLF